MYLKKILLMSSLKKPLLFILTCVWSIVFLVSYTPSALAQKFVRCKINDLSDTTANIRNFPSSSRYSLYEEKSQVKFRLANGVVVTVVANTYDGNWSFIYRDGQWGWVFDRLLNCEIGFNSGSEDDRLAVESFP